MSDFNTSKLVYSDRPGVVNIVGLSNSIHGIDQKMPLAPLPMDTRKVFLNRITDPRMMIAGKQSYAL